jgi:hypothetical protein
VVGMYVRLLLSLRHVADLLFERGIDICHETVRQWWNRSGGRRGRELIQHYLIAAGTHLAEKAGDVRLTTQTLGTSERPVNSDFSSVTER